MNIVACPVFVDGLLLGAFSVELAVRADPQQRAALQVFSRGAAWLEILLRSQAATAVLLQEKIDDGQPATR